MRAGETAALNDRQEQALRLLLLVWLTTVLFLCGVALVAAIVLLVVTPPVHDAAFYAQFCLLDIAFYHPQPAKNAAYVVACLASPFLLAGGYMFACGFVRRIPGSKLVLAFRWVNLGSALFFVWCLLPMIYCPRPAMQAEPPIWLSYHWFFADEPFFTLSRAVFLGVALLLVWFFYGLRATRQNRNLAFLAVMAAGLLVIVTRFYVPVEINDEWRFAHHLNPLVFALSQAMGGYHYLVQNPHRYGGYIEFLAPVLAWFPRRVETMLVPLGVLNIAAMACLLGAVRLLVRSPLQLLLAGWSLLGMLAIDSRDNYYQFTAVRLILPAVGLLLAILYFRRPCLWLYAVVSALAALAPWWNQDSGVVIWCSWTATLAARAVAEKSWREAVRQVAMQLFVAIGAAAAFLLYLRMCSGQWPDLRLLVAYQHVFVGLGYFCLPMLVPDAWMLVVAIYALCLAVLVIFYRRGAYSWRTSSLLMTVLTGIGLFSYFMGRSAESNLVDAAFLIPILLGWLLSGAHRLTRLGQLSPRAWVLLVPLIFIQAWWALLFVLALPNLAGQSIARLAESGQGIATTPFGRNVSFVQSHTAAGEKIYLLSDQAGFYLYLSNTVSDLDLASTDEFVWTKDIDRLVAAIDSRQIPKLFVDQNFFATQIYKPEVYDRINAAIAASYQVEAQSDTGRLTLYAPR